MPVYEYRCKNCKYQFEIKQSIHDKPVEICPKCKGKVQKIIGSSIGISFKGSGFYVTDSKKTAKEHKKSHSVKTDKKTDVPKKPESKGEAKH